MYGQRSSSAWTSMTFSSNGKPHAMTYEEMLAMFDEWDDANLCVDDEDDATT